MAENNGMNGTGGTNGAPPPSPAPALHIPKPTKQNLRQDIVRDPYTVIPHISTYSGKYNTVNKDYYIYWDEALRNSQQNSLAMRRDPFIEELLRHRQLPVVTLPYHIEVDDPEHPDQLSISQTIQKIIADVPRLKSMMLSLLEAIFYGRYGSQLQIGPRKVAGNTWNSVVNNIPVNGDKFRYKWDGTPGIAIYSGDRTPDQMESDQTKFLIKNEKYIETTMLGPALFLKTQALRDRFIIHRFQGSDTDYLFEIDEAQSVFGLGLRSRLYWGWSVRTEVLSWALDAIQRIGANGMLFGFYPSGNPKAQGEVLASIRQLCKDNIGAFPVPMTAMKDNFKDWIQRIEPSAVGYDVIMQIVSYFDGIMRRATLGQDLSSESKPTGLGGGAAGLHSDVRQDMISYDAEMLAETMTNDLVGVIQRYNKWTYEGKTLQGSELPFGCRWKFDIDKGDGPQRLEAAMQLFQMGVPLDTDDVRKVGGFAPPKKKSTALINHQNEQQKQVNEAGQPAFNEMNRSLKGIVSEGQKAKQLGMTGKPSRFSKADDCGHDDDGDFSEGNTCQSEQQKRHTRDVMGLFGIRQKPESSKVKSSKEDRLRGLISKAKAKERKYADRVTELDAIVRKGKAWKTTKKAQKISEKTEPLLEEAFKLQDIYTKRTDRLKDELEKLLGGQTSRFSKPKESPVLSGRLYVSRSGWGLLSVPNDLVYGIYDAMNEPGIELPPNSGHGKQKLNAHISVFTKDEISKIGPENLKHRGHHFHYNLGPIKRVKPAGWSEMSHVWFVEVDSPELEDLRESYGLSRIPKKGKHQFHLSIAVRRSSSKPETARFSKPSDCGHDSGGFSRGNICGTLRGHKQSIESSLKESYAKLPKNLRSGIKRVSRTYLSTFETANRTSKILARKNGYTAEQAKTLSSILAIADLAGTRVIQGASVAAGLGPLGTTIGGMVPMASAGYLLYSGAKNPVAALKAARIAVRRTMRRIKNTSRLAKIEETNERKPTTSDE